MFFRQNTVRNKVLFISWSLEDCCAEIFPGQFPHYRTFLIIKRLFVSNNTRKKNERKQSRKNVQNKEEKKNWTQ